MIVEPCRHSWIGGRRKVPVLRVLLRQTCCSRSGISVGPLQRPKRLGMSIATLSLEVCEIQPDMMLKCCRTFWIGGHQREVQCLQEGRQREKVLPKAKVLPKVPSKCQQRQETSFEWEPLCLLSSRLSGQPTANSGATATVTLPSMKRASSKSLLTKWPACCRRTLQSRVRMGHSKVRRGQLQSRVSRRRLPRRSCQ